MDGTKEGKQAGWQAGKIKRERWRDRGGRVREIGKEG